MNCQEQTITPLPNHQIPLPALQEVLSRHNEALIRQNEAPLQNNEILVDTNALRRDKSSPQKRISDKNYNIGPLAHEHVLITRAQTNNLEKTDLYNEIKGIG